MADPKPAVDPSRLLDAVPMANEAVRVERHGETVILFVQVQRRWWMRGPLSWLLPMRNEKGMALDALGREVWEACDGKQTTEQIIERFARKHRLRFHEARLAVIGFLRSLVDRRLIVLVLREQLEGS
jgi:hypothetical protein